jgi:branched-chain amino acid transport system permease protein
MGMFGFDVILQQIFYGLVLGSSYVLIAVGFSLIWGIVGVLNLAHGELFMVGAFGSYFIFNWMGGGIFLPFVTAVGVAFTLGLAIEKWTIEPLRRQKKTDYEMGTLMMTIGVSMFLMNLVLLLFGPRYKGIPQYFDGSIQLGQIIMTYDQLMIFIVAIVLILLLMALFKYTRIGIAMRAVSENSEAAALAGIPINKILCFSFGLSAALAGAAGALLLPVYNVYPTVGANVILLAFSIVIFGGLGSVKGAIFSGFLIGILESLAVLYISSSWKDVVVFLTVILVLTFRPRGLMGTKES